MAYADSKNGNFLAIGHEKINFLHYPEFQTFWRSISKKNVESTTALLIYGLNLPITLKH